MRILYHHRTRAVDAQGVHIREMVQAFSELSHTVEIVSLVDTRRPPSTDKERRTPGWLSILRALPFANELISLAYNALAVPWLIWKVRKFRPDVIYERYSLLNCAGVVAARVCGIPIVLEVNSPLALEQSRDGELRTGKFAHWTERVICNWATNVIAVSGPLRRILIEEGVDPARVVVMPNGANPSHFSGGERSRELRRSAGLEGQTVIGFVGWFKRWHGLEFLIEAFAKSDPAARKASLLLIGDGPAMAELQALVQARGLKDSVRFTGPLPHSAIPAWLDVMDIAVQPAANEYCCPVKIIEYMAARKPIVAPRQDNIQELIADGREGLLFTPGNTEDLNRALARLIDNPVFRLRLGECAYAAIGEHRMTWSENARRVLDLIAARTHAPEEARKMAARGSA